MRRRSPSAQEDFAGPPSGPRACALEPSAEDRRERTTEELYAEQWRYVLTLLLGCGIPAQDAEDVAQAVWMNVHRRRDSYDAPTHKTPRAWITGFVVRCAANHRRTQRRRPLLMMEDPGGLLAAVGLDPEQAAILMDLHRLIPEDDQRVALLLQVQHGLTVAEIAAVQGVTESAVERKLHMARKNMKSGDDEKSRGAYLGFGSLEALAEALKPKPIPDEVGRRQWERIAELIRQEEASPSTPEADPPPSEPPPSSYPPAAALPALASPTVPALVALGKAKLAALLFFAFVGGAGAGVGGILLWQAHTAARHGRVVPAMDSAPPVSAPPAPPSARTSPSAPGSTAATVAVPSSLPSPTALGSSTTATMGPSTATSAAALNEEASHRLLSRMRESLNARQFSMVLSLAEQHARRFGTTHVREREALRIQALRETGRTTDAEQRARTVIATHPEHRRAMERAAGRPLP